MAGSVEPNLGMVVKHGGTEDTEKKRNHGRTRMNADFVAMRAINEG